VTARQHEAGLLQSSVHLARCVSGLCGDRDAPSTA